MINDVPDPLSSPDDLTDVLERLGVQRAGAKTSAEIGDAQVELLLARIATLTGALRTPSPSDTARLASRVLLADLALVAAQFRGRMTSSAPSVAGPRLDPRAAADVVAAIRALSYSYDVMRKPIQVQRRRCCRRRYDAAIR